MQIGKHITVVDNIHSIISSAIQNFSVEQMEHFLKLLEKVLDRASANLHSSFVDEIFLCSFFFSYRYITGRSAFKIGESSSLSPIFFWEFWPIFKNRNCSCIYICKTTSTVQRIFDDDLNFPWNTLTFQFSILFNFSQSWEEEDDKSKERLLLLLGKVGREIKDNQIVTQVGWFFLIRLSPGQNKTPAVPWIQLIDLTTVPSL